jgi:methylenetetrahydrofolate reductase (NADPH)
MQGPPGLPQTRFAQCLAERRFALTAEIVPPLSCAAQDLLDKARPLLGIADAVNVTDGAGAHAHMSAMAAAALLLDAGIEPILQLTCRDRNRIALQAELMGAAALGVRNLLLLRGDDPAAGDQPDAKPVFDLDSLELTETARLMRDEQRLPHGVRLKGAAPFFIGAVDTPIDPPANWRPERLKAKIAAGAQFVQTQFCMDAGLARRYAARLREFGLDIFVLIGVTPLRSAGAAAWMRHHLPGTIISQAIIERMERAADPAAEGRRICIEMIAELAEIPGIAGAHIMAPGLDKAAAEVIAAARQALPAAARR